MLQNWCYATPVRQDAGQRAAPSRMCLPPKSDGSRCLLDFVKAFTFREQIFYDQLSDEEKWNPKTRTGTYKLASDSLEARLKVPGVGPDLNIALQLLLCCPATPACCLPYPVCLCVPCLCPCPCPSPCAAPHFIPKRKKLYTGSPSDHMVK